MSLPTKYVGIVVVTRGMQKIVASSPRLNRKGPAKKRVISRRGKTAAMDMWFWSKRVVSTMNRPQAPPIVARIAMVVPIARARNVTRG